MKGSPKGGEVIDRRTFARHEASVAALMNSLFRRHLLAVYAAFEGDPLQAIVLGEVADHHLPTNAYSIAQATGIPRETVRRKVDALVRRGWLARDAHAHLEVGTCLLADFSDFNFDRLRDLLLTAERIQAVLGARGRSRKPAPGGTARTSRPLA